jgi:hypothetical protein
VIITCTRSVSQELYERIRADAKKKHRTFNAQVIHCCKRNEADIIYVDPRLRKDLPKQESHDRVL